MTRRRLNWKRIAPFALCCVCLVAAIKKFADQEYIHAAVAVALALFYLIVGLRGVSQVSEPLSASMSEAAGILAEGQDRAGP